MPRGEEHGNAKLTEQDVKEIRRLNSRKKDPWTQVELAKKFGVSKSLINKVIKRVIWDD